MVDGVRTFTLTNKHVPEVVNVPVTKVWDDDSDRDSLQPASIQVQLYADNSAVGDPVTLNAGNTWSYTWENMPVNANGQAIAYTVLENRDLTRQIAECRASSRICYKAVQDLGMVSAAAVEAVPVVAPETRPFEMTNPAYTAQSSPAAAGMISGSR